jgi:precorrin-6A/cobalt-precorrin-6A reductase
MIGLILGTSEGKTITKVLNKYTDDLFLSVVSSYGASLLKEFNYKILNTKPLKEEELKKALINNNVDLLIDASHPYATSITKTSMKVSNALNIDYIRYERKSVLDKYKNFPNIIEVNNYESLKDILNKIKGNILNTTGSRNISKILNLNLKNRIIHRVLPTPKVICECSDLNIKVDDIIAMKGPFSKEFNLNLIKEFNIKIILLKDSGIEGGTLEKLNAITELNNNNLNNNLNINDNNNFNSNDNFNNDVYGIIIKREKIDYNLTFNNEEELINYLLEKHYIK